MSTKYKIKLNNKIYEVEVEKGEAQLLDAYDAPVAVAPAPVAAPVAAPAAPAAAPAPAPAPAAAVKGEPVPAPFPGVVVSVKVTPGQAVKKGDLLLVIEAMKMENEVFAPRDASIGQVLVSQGKTVSTGDTLVSLV